MQRVAYREHTNPCPLFTVCVLCSTSLVGDTLVIICIGFIHKRVTKFYTGCQLIVTLLLSLGLGPAMSNQKKKKDRKEKKKINQDYLKLYYSEKVQGEFLFKKVYGES